MLLDARATRASARHPSQPYFHKSVLLVLEHEPDGMTVGVLLNRPSTRSIDGWRLCFGGPVGEAGLFGGVRGQREDAANEKMGVICLHALEGSLAAERCSYAVVRGLWWTTLGNAQQLAAKGIARKGDFWLLGGYAGWGTGQLQAEVDEGSWALASSASDTLVQELFAKRATLNQPRDAAAAVEDGCGTWEALLTSVGRAEVVEGARLSEDDAPLRRWVGAHLRPPVAVDDDE